MKYESFLETVGEAILEYVLNKVVKAAFEEWRNSREEYEKEIRRQKEQVRRYLKQAEQYYDYRVMVDMHHQSFNVANHAYSLLQDARKSIDALSKTLMQTKIKKDELIEKRKKTRDHNEILKISATLDGIVNLRNKLFADREELQRQEDEFKVQTKELNNQTHLLKIAIRDKTGYHGQIWYDRLEERKRLKQADSRDSAS